jgi:hypothetical protein
MTGSPRWRLSVDEIKDFAWKAGCAGAAAIITVCAQHLNLIAETPIEKTVFPLIAAGLIDLAARISSDTQTPKKHPTK